MVPQFQKTVCNKVLKLQKRISELNLFIESALFGKYTPLNYKAPQSPQTAVGFIGNQGASAGHVKEVRQRFLVVNEGRIQRIKEGLQIKQQ